MAELQSSRKRKLDTPPFNFSSQLLKCQVSSIGNFLFGSVSKTFAEYCHEYLAYLHFLQMEHSVLLVENQFKKLTESQQEKLGGMLDKLRELPWESLQVSLMASWTKGTKRVN